jgi:hypothetical protein
MGQILIPDEAVTLHFESNYSTLENRLQEPDAFDVVLDCKTGDILEIVKDNDNDSVRAVYGFKYTKNQWNRFEIDPFELMGQFDEIRFGKLINHKKKE